MRRFGALLMIAIVVDCLVRIDDVQAQDSLVSHSEHMAACMPGVTIEGTGDDVRVISPPPESQRGDLWRTSDPTRDFGNSEWYAHPRDATLFISFARLPVDASETDDGRARIAARAAMVACFRGESVNPAPSGVVRTPATVVAITDGDTLTVQFDDGATERVRLIGIDTPEIYDPRQPVQCYAAESSARLGELALHRRVGVELDVTQRDRYGRLLAYLWIAEEDGTVWMLNERMLSDGYAQTLTIPPNVRYVTAFAAAQQAAREQQLGLWNACVPSATAATESPAPTATSTRVPIPPAANVSQPKPSAAASSAGGRAAPSGEWTCPESHPIKGNRNSMIYHMKGQQAYERTKPEDCFSNEADAVAAGYRRAQR